MRLNEHESSITTAEGIPESSFGLSSGNLDFLAGGGEMGRLVRSIDWSGTPLGPIESWSQSLRTTVSLCLNSNFPVCLAWGPDNTMIYNDGYWPICGDKHPRSMGQSFIECWADVWPLVGEAYQRALGGETQFFENMQCFINRYGFLEEIFCTFSYSPIRDETGKVIGIFHPVTECTDKTLADRRTQMLRDLAVRSGNAKTIEEVFLLSAQVCSDYALDLPFAMFYRLDADGRMLHWIAGTGVPPGTPISPERIEIQTAGSWPFSEALFSGQTVPVELEKIFGTVPYSPYPETPKTAFVIPMHFAGSESPSVFLIAGISARLAVNDSYRNFLDLVVTTVTAAVANAGSYEEERKRAEALAEIDRAKTAFFNNVSHEFRTPLTLMLGPMQDILNDTEISPDTQRKLIQTAYRNALRLQKLVNTLLDFSRIEAGRIQASYQLTDLAGFTKELASMFDSATEKAALKLVVDCPPLPEPVYVDHDMWEKIVLNLLSNAFKHTFEGEILVRLMGVGNQVELIVRDTGVGIPLDQLPHLFERFHRVPNARSRTHEGSGIGLALVQELVKLHGGCITVESTVDQGSTFRVTLPTGTAHLDASRIEVQSDLASTALGAKPFVEEVMHWLPSEEKIEASDQVQTASYDERAWPSVTRPGKARILLADDNRDMREYVRRLLEPYCEVEAASDGQAALEAARRLPPDLVLSDVMMPKMNGFELIAALRSESSLRKIPVILFSARAGEEAKVEGLEAGADDYLIKPFHARELLARVKTNLDLHRTRHQETIQELEKVVMERTAQLQAANKELEAFSYSVSHDLRAPLRTIDGFSQAVIENYADLLDEKGKHYLNRIRDGSQQMTELIDGMLSLSRLTWGAFTGQDNIALGAMAQDIVTELLRQEPDRKAEFKIQTDIVVTGDRHLLQSALQNLLGNAWKFTSKRSHTLIEFGTFEQNGQPVYYVKDNGAGFDMTYASKLFGVFQRFHTVSDFHGTGIGLASVQRIIQRHGGKVWAEATVDQGATFYFTLQPSGILQRQMSPDG